jgi:hypothetical protein
MFHHFPGRAGRRHDCLVRSTDFTYSHEQDPEDAPATRSTPSCWPSPSPATSGRRRLSEAQPAAGRVRIHPARRAGHGGGGRPEAWRTCPSAWTAAYQWTDLHGEGIPGILTEQGGAWFYKRNLSPINERRNGARTEAKFAPVELVATKPNLALAGGAQFMDLAGDGQPDLVVLDGPMPGLYEHDGEEGWQPFRPFTSRLNRDTRDPNLKIRGPGRRRPRRRADHRRRRLRLASFAGRGRLRPGPPRRIRRWMRRKARAWSSPTAPVHLSRRLSGDGLTDLVRIRNGEVCYWPNLGYGRFGAKVTMDHAPHFDHPDQFDQKRIRLADIDGTGTTDIIYLHRDGVRLYFNQSGNSWSEPQVLNVFPRVDDLVSIVPTDLLGNGTACLVWSSPLPGDARGRCATST